MNVVTVMTTSFTMDGITNVVKNYYKHINKENVNIDFILPNRPTEEFSEFVKENGGSIFVVKGRINDTFNYIKNINRIFKQTKYDIIHAHGNSHTLAIEMIIAKLNNIPIRIAHAHNTTTKFTKIHSLLTIPFKMSYTNGIACGYDAGNWLFKDSEFDILDNGVEVEKYKYNVHKRKIKRSELNLSDDNIVLGNIGHFSEQKNQLYLVDVFHKIYLKNPNYRLLLIGDGKLRTEIERRIKKYSLEEVVILLGKQKDIPSLLSALDLLVMPSIYEGLPLTLIEAQSADLRCFISNKITDEVNITDRVSFFNLEEDKEIIADKIIRISMDSFRRDLFKGYKMMSESKYNIVESANRLKELYNRYYEKSKGKIFRSY